MNGEILLTIEESARALKIGRTHLYRYIQTGELRSVKLGRARRVAAAALADFVERLEADQAEEVDG